VLMNVFGLPLTRLLGYAPGWAFAGTDLPRGVFEQWTRWVMMERYLLSDPDLKTLSNFANYKGALRSVHLSDDPWATRPAIDLLCTGFTATTPDIVTITPKDAGVERIGHLGFFRPEHRDTLWRGAAEWLEATG
jgi:predicted alpha/beta hydrolase